MKRAQTFVEHDILRSDAESGIFYQTFEDFWQKRMEPMQFIAPDAKGALAAVRASLREQAREQFILFDKTVLQFYPAPADGCGGSPQAGGASLQMEPFNDHCR